MNTKTSVIKLIKRVKVYSPDYLGVKDLLFVNDRIIKIEDDIQIDKDKFNVDIINGEGKIAVPGFIDQHVHLIGGGGEAGFHSRTPEVMLSSLIKGGITTVVGLLGTDGSTRHVETLFAKAKGLEYEGITTYILTGSYEYPGPTITNNIKNDILFIDKVIGVKIALSDHRSSHINKNELIRLASQVRVSSMLSGKAGIITVHMGDAKEGLNLIKEIVRETDIPIKHFMPTHVNRNGNLFDQAIEYVNMGGYMDMTAGSVTNEKNGSLKASQAIAKCISRNVCVSNIIISTDGNGSTSEYDNDGKLIKMGASTVDTLIKELRDMVMIEKIDLQIALKFITSNPAKALGIYPNKGIIAEGSDADIILLNSDLFIDTVFSKGKLMMESGDLLIKGTFE